MRWLYHIVRRDEELADDPRDAERVAPTSWATERLVHASFQDAVAESVKIHFSKDDPSSLRVLQIDPRRVDVAIDLAATLRGPMPHLLGTIPKDAIRAALTLEAVAEAPDRVTGTRFVFVAFEGMTLLDLIGVHDPISRIAGMGFDPESRTEIVSADLSSPWGKDGCRLELARVRPSLLDFDVVIVAGGMGTRALVDDPRVIDWIRAFPANRLLASVCTGSLVLGAAGRLRGRRATTHHRSFDLLSKYGATLVRERVVDDGQIVTAGGVSCGIDLGLHLVERIEGAEIAGQIAAQMEYRRGA